MQLIIDLLSYLAPYGMYSYAIMFGILIACGFGFPMPEDVILITGGILAARGIVDPYLVFIITMSGVLMGDGIIFLLGFKMGPHIKETRLFKKVLNENNSKKISEIFDKYGDKVIFAARFMPGLRVPIFMSAGIFKVPIWKFFMLDGFAALISVPLWIWVGYVFGANLEKLDEKIQQFQYGMYGVLIGGTLLITGIWLLKKKMKPSIVKESN
jgi:membrane protein DedA with SNARE-associated domain